MTFSPLGLVVSIAVLVPNLLLLGFPPRGGKPSVHVAPVVAWAERAGQALCLVVPVLTASDDPVWWWAVPAAGTLAAYYALWARYLRGGRSLTLLYDTVCRMPVPMAILPVVVFLTTGGLLADPWIAVSAVVLAAGHLPTAVATARAVIPG